MNTNKFLKHSALCNPPFMMFYLARRPPLEFCTQVMKSSRKECSLVWRCRGRFPSSASRIVGEWDKASPFPRIPECDLHTCERKIKIKAGTVDIKNFLPKVQISANGFLSFKVESPEEKLPPKSQDPPLIHYLEFIYTGLTHGLCKIV